MKMSVRKKLNYAVSPARAIDETSPSRSGIRRCFYTGSTSRSWRYLAKKRCWQHLFVAGLTLLLAFSVSSARSQSGPAPRPGSFGATVLSNNPVAFWQLNETNSAAAGSLAAYDYTGHGYSGTYGADALNGFDGIVAPQPPNYPYPAFGTNQGAVRLLPGDINTSISVPFLNLDTNAVTIALWINPGTGQTPGTGLFMNRTIAGDAAGFGFGYVVNATNSMAELGYIWNTNGGATLNFNSGLYPVAGVWQLAVLVVQSNSATIYLDYIDPNTAQPVLMSAVNPIAHTPEAFGTGLVLIGDDVANGNAGDASRVFNGDISDVAVYNRALTNNEVLQLFSAGINAQGFPPHKFPPQLNLQPHSAYVIAGSKARLSASGINGFSPFAYQWQLNGTNIGLLADNTNFSGANSNELTILSVTTNEVGSYHLVITNVDGTTVSSNATVVIQSTNLVGEWLSGSANFTDVSGYIPAGTHNGYLVGNGNFMFTNDVPAGKSGQSLYLFNGDTGLAINNSSTLDSTYDNTFDDKINNSFTVSFWAKGWPGNWAPFVSKWGEGPGGVPSGGWQLRPVANTANPSFAVQNGGAGSANVTIGTNLFQNDLAATSFTIIDTNDWHFYAGVFDASTGVRSLYVDALLVANESSNNTPYTLAAAEHLVIGGKDSPPGNNFGEFSTLEIYDVRLYNYAVGNGGLNPPGFPPHISSLPPFLYTYPGSNAQISAIVSGHLPFTYQWQLNGTNVDLLADNTNFSGINSNVLTILHASTYDAGSYRLLVTNTDGNAISGNVAVIIQNPSVIGEWFKGTASLADVSGYTPAGTHNGFIIGNGHYAFTNDAPPGKTGQSIYFFNNDTGMAITNTSTLDENYTNTFDDPIQTAFTVAFWARGYPGQWSPWVSKGGENGVGWQFRDGGNNIDPAFTIRGASGTVTQGLAVFGNPEDMRGTIAANDGQWHFYVGAYSVATGLRSLYVDGVLAATSTNNRPYTLAPGEHLCIGAREPLSDFNFQAFSSFEIYDVRIFNYATTASSFNPIFPDPVILVQPQSKTAYVGGQVTLSATIKGTAPFTNHWQLGGTNLADGFQNGTLVVGSTSNVLTLYNLNASFQGTYDLVVSNALGMTISSNAVLTVESTVPPPGANLVGAWLTGAANLADASGYSPAGRHDGYGVTGAGIPSFNYTFTNDVPPGVPSGQSLFLNGTIAIAITNSSTLDANYTNTFDDILNTNGMTVLFWAKGLPGAWNPWLSKFGENGDGWQLRINANRSIPCWTIRGTGGSEDLLSTIGPVDTNWHFYAGTYNPVTGNRTLYVDGELAAAETGQGPLTPSTLSHLTIGGRDQGGNAFGNYFAGEIYGVRIYNTELSPAQINPPWPGPIPVPTPGPLPLPIRNGNQLLLTWSVGTLLQATNLTGPWTPTGATSPYTNDMTTNGPRMFYRLSVP